MSLMLFWINVVVICQMLFVMWMVGQDAFNANKAWWTYFIAWWTYFIAWWIFLSFMYLSGTIKIADG